MTLGSSVNLQARVPTAPATARRYVRVDGEVEAGDYGPVDVGLTVPYHFLGLVFLLGVGDLGISQIVGERDVWPWILPIHPRDVQFKCVEDVSLYFPLISKINILFRWDRCQLVEKIND